MRFKSTIVLGLGNPLMGDEGVGTKLIEMLQCRASDYGGVEFVDAGTGGMNVLHLIAGAEKAVIIDCALMSTPPGAIQRFTLDDIETNKPLAGQSLHESDVIKVIQLSKKLGEAPGEIIFFGIEPETIQQRPYLSGKLEKKLGYYIETILEELY